MSDTLLMRYRDGKDPKITIKLSERVTGSGLHKWIDSVAGTKYIVFRAGLIDSVYTKQEGIDLVDACFINGGYVSGETENTECFFGTALAEGGYGYANTIWGKYYNNSGWNTIYGVPYTGNITNTFENTTTWSATPGEYFLVFAGGHYSSAGVTLTGATVESVLGSIGPVSWSSVSAGGYVCVAKATSSSITATNYGSGVYHLSLGNNVVIA